MADSKTRKWFITINNYEEKGYSLDKIEEVILEYKDTLVYGCYCAEIGLEEHTPHVHIYLQFKNAKRFSTMQKKYKGSHLDMSKGTAKESRDYIRKEGRYLDSAKHETNLIDTFREFGQLPVEEQGKRNDLNELYELIKDGNTNAEIFEYNPKYMKYADKLDKIRQDIIEDKYKNEFRKLDVTYIFGTTATGKTRYVMEKYGYENVYRVTDYEHPFDSYSGQEIILFDEFRSSLKISDMLNFLDGYPCQLPARFNNKWACYKTVYIISNIKIEQQYEYVQENEKLTYDAFMRRIHHFMVFANGEKRYYDNYFNYCGGFEYELLDNESEEKICAKN